jgi:hypothetical protein
MASKQTDQISVNDERDAITVNGLLGSPEKKYMTVEVQQVEAVDAEAASGFDYAGARPKTNPLEIALVKKLDRRIMPALWSMYFLNYVSRAHRFAFCRIPY